ncbi:MAG: DUF2070 family protein [Thermoplasmata archaeon]
MTERTYRLSFFKSPNVRVTIGAILLVYVATWFALYPWKTNKLIDVFLIIVFPTIFSALVIPYMGWYEERMRIHQSFLLALVSLVITSFFIVLYDILQLSVPVIILVGYAIPVSLRYLVFRTVFISHPFKPLLHTLFQSIVALPLIHMFYPLRMVDLVLFTLLIMVGLSSVMSFIALINRPFLKDFNISGMDLIRTSYRLYAGKEKGKEELEGIFRRTSIKSDVNFTVFSFKTDEKEKALFVIPELHPGPIKGIAGSMLPELLSKEMRKEHGMVFTFHGCSTHVQNPIRKEDCLELVEEIKKSFENMNYTNVGTSFFNTHRELFVGAQVLGEGVFLTVSFSPHPTEDIDAPIGEIVSLNAREKGYSRIGFVDAHNCVKKGAIEVYYPSRRYRKIVERTNDIIDKLKEKNMGLVGMGTASMDGYVKSEGIAGEGIKVAVFEVNHRKNALVLIDGNNMENGLRENIQEEISDLVDISEVHTTDSHEVNTLVKDYNPVGLSMDHSLIAEEVRNVTEEAVRDIEPVQIGVNKGILKNFPLMGPLGSHRLTAVIETVYRVAPIAGGMSFVIQFLATSVVLSLL